MNTANTNSNGARKLGEWVIDKMVIFVLALVITLLVWVVSQVFAMNGTIESIRLETSEKFHDIQMTNAARLATVESDLKTIKESTRRTEERLNEVCKELKIR